MNIGVYFHTNDDCLSGVEYYALGLIHALMRHGAEHRYTIFTNRPGMVLQAEADVRIVPAKHGQSRVRRIVWEHTVLPRLANRERVDVLHCPAYICPVAFTRVPCVVTIHDTVALDHPRWCKPTNAAYYRLMLGRAARKAARIVAVSAETARSICRHVDAGGRIRVVRPGIDAIFHESADLGDVRARYGLPAGLHGKLHTNHHGVPWSERPADVDRSAPGPATVLAVARLVPKKGLDHLVRAMADVVRKGIPCRLVIAGDGPQRRQLAELAERLGVAGCVRFTGWQDQAGVGRLLRSATILAVPSVIAADGDRDGIPNVILEAFAAGVPVVATRLPGIGEAIEHDTTGVLVEPGNADGLARAIESLLADEALRHRLATAAWEAGRARFDLCVNARGISELLKEAHAC